MREDAVEVVAVPSLDPFRSKRFCFGLSEHLSPGPNLVSVTRAWGNRSPPFNVLPGLNLLNISHALLLPNTSRLSPAFSRLFKQISKRAPRFKASPTLKLTDPHWDDFLHFTFRM